MENGFHYSIKEFEIYLYIYLFIFHVPTFAKIPFNQQIQLTDIFLDLTINAGNINSFANAMSKVRLSFINFRKVQSSWTKSVPNFMKSCKQSVAYARTQEDRQTDNREACTSGLKKTLFYGVKI
jgi:hypothetical protein